MSITMRGGERPVIGVPEPGRSPGRHRTGRQRHSGCRELFAVREFRVLWSAQVLSYVGDQVAQVAIAVLVYARTHSVFATALAYALTYLPAVAGGPLLSGLATRLPRRQVLLTLDLARAGLLELMALPRLPLPGMCALLVVAVALGPPFSAARSALLPEFVPTERLARGRPLADMTFQASQVAGFVLGGALVAGFGAYRALAVDALSFCLSAGLIAGWIRPGGGWADKSRAGERRTGESWPSESRAGERRAGMAPSRPRQVRRMAILRHPPLRTLLLFGWLAGFLVVPEGLAAPYAHSLGGGALATGLLMTCVPAGMLVGAALVARLTRPDERLRMIGWLAMASCAPLAGCLLRPPLWAVAALWTLAGAGGAYQLAAAAAFMRTVAPGERARACLTAQSGVVAAQGGGILLAGVAAAAVGPQAAVAFAGLAGAAAAAALASGWSRHRDAVAAE